MLDFLDWGLRRRDHRWVARMENRHWLDTTGTIRRRRRLERKHVRDLARARRRPPLIHNGRKPR